MRTKWLIRVGLLVVASFGVALTADAAQETINGNICQSIYPPDNTLGTGLYHNQASVSNQSGGFRYVNCPIHRLVIGTAGWNPAVVATDGTNQLWCAANSIDEFGNITQSISKAIPSGGGAKLINWPNMSSSTWGYFGIGCTMPNSSSVQQLLYVEF